MELVGNVSFSMCAIIHILSPPTPPPPPYRINIVFMVFLISFSFYYCHVVLLKHLEETNGRDVAILIVFVNVKSGFSLGCRIGILTG